MSATAGPHFVVYSRQGCHLCEVLIESLLPLIRGRGSLEVRDIDSREDWRAAYDTLVPVLCHGQRELCRYELDRAAVQAVLASSPD